MVVVVVDEPSQNELYEKHKRETGPERNFLHRAIFFLTFYTLASTLNSVLGVDVLSEGPADPLTL